VTDRVGSTSISALMALISRAALVVANDSAAVHMAVGFDRPTVALYGPTDVARVGPYGREADVIQHREPGDTLDHKDDANAAMMARIGLEEVLNACRVRLKN
jgi:heptosyltransferase-1